MTRCCIRSGYLSPEKAELLNQLEALGVELPDGVQVWGARDGLAWRVVDRRGYDPPEGPLGGRHSLRATVAGIGIAVAVEDGRRVVSPVA